MYSELDKIDVSMYLIYEDIEKIMSEINKDYDDILQFMTINEFCVMVFSIGVLHDVSQIITPNFSVLPEKQRKIPCSIIQKSEFNMPPGATSHTEHTDYISAGISFT